MLLCQGTEALDNQILESRLGCTGDQMHAPSVAEVEVMLKGGEHTDTSVLGGYMCTVLGPSDESDA